MSSRPSHERTVVVGAGPAGLTAALELGKLGREGVVFEADDVVGGISRSVVFRGCRMDIGGHRFFTQVAEVEALWHEIVGDNLLVRQRMSRIYYRDSFFDYPLKPLNALRGLGLIERFYYPRLGPGMMWERCRELVATHGIETHTRTRVVRIQHAGKHVVAVDVEEPDSEKRNEACGSVISSMPIGALVGAMDPAPPQEVQDAAKSLRYRDFLIVGLIVERDRLFADNWIYVHSPEVRVGRIQNFKNWSPDMVSDPELSFVGLEYFANRSDDLWTMPDAELVELAAAEAETLGLFATNQVQAGTVFRMPKAYPVYDGNYEAHLQAIRDWLDRFDNLFTVGRNGQHRYNNQDHSMLAGLFAARNVAGAELDLWSINEEASFHEEVRGDDAADRGVRDRLTPSRVEGDVDDLLENAFACYDEVALGSAIGITGNFGLAVATVVPLLGSNERFVPMLSLLVNYLFGYEVSWPGLAVGIVEAGLVGFTLGWITAKLINRLSLAFERDLERRLATLTTLEAVEEGNVERE